MTKVGTEEATERLVDMLKSIGVKGVPAACDALSTLGHDGLAERLREAVRATEETPEASRRPIAPGDMVRDYFVPLLLVTSCICVGAGLHAALGEGTWASALFLVGTLVVGPFVTILLLHLLFWPRERRMWYATDELAASVSGGDTLPLRFLRYWAASWQDPLRMAAIATLRRVHKRLKPVAGTLLCRVHLTRFEEDHCLAGEGYRERLDFKQRMVPLFCCRHCGKPDHMMIGVREVVCVVDTRRSEEVPVRLPEGAAPENGVLRAFWVRTEPLFDFDVVEIVHTDDFEVERFCIQVGNDTDPFRAGRCRTTRCRVAAGCELSENTRRILKATFGKVEFDDGEA